MPFGLFKSDIELSLALEADTAVPGAQLTGRVTIAGELDDKVQAARVELRCVNEYLDEETNHSRDHGPSTRTVTRTEKVVADGRELGTPGDPNSIAGEHAVTFTVPPDAAPTSEIPAGMVRWEVAAIVDRKRAKDAGSEAPVVVRGTRDSASRLMLAPPEIDQGCPMELVVADRVVAAGSEISGTLIVRPREAVDEEEIRVEVWAEREDPAANQRQGVGKGESRVVLAGPGALAAGQRCELPFTVRVPAGAASIRAPKNSLTWYLEGVVARGRMRRDHNVRLPLAVHNG